jgi:glycosyltransferase involved in cell wall biosynthesis
VTDKAALRHKEASERPMISIVTVVLNAATSLERTILSVVNQDFDDFEYVVIDGGSTDGSTDIIRKYESKIAYWCTEPDDGLYDAMNKGVRACRGKWILFLGADDVLVATLRDISEFLTDEQTVYYGNVYMPKRGLIYDGEFTAYKIMWKNICQQAIFYPRAVFESYSFDTKYKLWADYALNIACFGDKRFHFQYIERLICLFNDTSGKSANAEDERFSADREALIKANLSPVLLLRYRLHTRYWRFRRWLSCLIRRRQIT